MTSASTGTIERLSPLVRQILAPNPSPFTFTGTQTFIVGRGDVAVIDPGPDSRAHVEALLRGLGDERVTAIVCTHTHRDHSPAARMVAERTGAPIVGCAPLDPPESEDGVDEAFDRGYRPDRILSDGARLEGNGWTLEAISTPGHTSNHICLALDEEGILFSGDHVMGWSTSIVSPPDGDMGAYVASLQKLLEREDRLYLPAHGPAVEQPRKLVRGLILHRRQREAQVLDRLRVGESRIPAIVAALYRDVDPRLHPAAARSVLAHLIDLAARGLVRKEDEEWRLAQG